MLLWTTSLVAQPPFAAIGRRIDRTWTADTRRTTELRTSSGRVFAWRRSRVGHLRPRASRPAGGRGWAEPVSTRIRPGRCRFANVALAAAARDRLRGSYLSRSARPNRPAPARSEATDRSEPCFMSLSTVVAVVDPRHLAGEPESQLRDDGYELRDRPRPGRPGRRRPTRLPARARKARRGPPSDVNTLPGGTLRALRARGPITCWRDPGRRLHPRVLGA